MTIPSFPVRPEDTLRSDSAGVAGATEIKNVVAISQANYDALASKDPNTLYVIT